MTNRLSPPSAHLSWKELACKDGTPYPFQWDARARALAAVFEAIRLAAGNTPIPILSAYRTPEHNRMVGGARNSQHVQGRALDLRPPKGLSVDAFYALIKRLATSSVPAIRGIGRYATFVHVDIRPGSHLALWRANGLKESGV
jgi:uncharacterized protein YcbK (DUF882 family)